jgi:hypothetical protein
VSRDHEASQTVDRHVLDVQVLDRQIHAASKYSTK